MKQELINELKIDLACGQNRTEGYFGIDAVPGEKVDAVVDLEEFPWPIESGSAEDIVCNHYIEHTSDLIKFMNEVYRILKPGGKIKIVAPYYTSIRCWQDPTHKRAISDATFLYYNKGWREANKLDHYPTECDFDYCVSPETLVLTSDLRWVRADSIKVDDSIIGVDEFRPGKGRHRRMINSNVEFIRNFDSKRYKVITDCGEIIVTPEHPFLTKRNKSILRWVQSSELKTGDKIKFVGDPWTDNFSDSWLSGILDEEGCLILPKVMKILGKYRPIRLLNKFKEILDGGKLGLPKDYATVIGIESLEDGPVVAIRTSTKTLITNGFISHNTYGYDINSIWANRSEEARNFAIIHYNNVVNDIHVVLTARPKSEK